MKKKTKMIKCERCMAMVPKKAGNQRYCYLCNGIVNKEQTTELRRKKRENEGTLHS